MASDSQQYDGFTEDDLRRFEQEQREYDLALDLAALIRRKPRNQKQKLIMEHIAKEKEQKKKLKNKWMALGSIHEPPKYFIEVQLDTGAGLNFITGDMAREWGLTKERLESPQIIHTANGPGGECEYHVFANWQGRPGCGGRVEFFVLPETSPITKPLIGIEGKKCWDELMDEQPKDGLCWSTLSKGKGPERIESAALRVAVLNQQSQLQLRKRSS